MTRRKLLFKLRMNVVLAIGMMAVIIASQEPRTEVKVVGCIMVLLVMSLFNYITYLDYKKSRE